MASPLTQTKIAARIAQPFSQTSAPMAKSRKIPGDLRPIIAIAMAHPRRASFGSLPLASLSATSLARSSQHLWWVSGDADVETRRNEYTFLGSGCNIRTHLLREAARRLVYFIEIWARDAEPSRALERVGHRGISLNRLVAGPTGSFLGFCATFPRPMQKRFGLNA